VRTKPLDRARRSRPLLHRRHHFVQVTVAVTPVTRIAESTSPARASTAPKKDLRAESPCGPTRSTVLFFMASDNTHHLEGAYLATGAFRYASTTHSRAAAIAEMRNFRRR
jgi:hypothetical protein